MMIRALPCLVALTSVTAIAAPPDATIVAPDTSIDQAYIALAETIAPATQAPQQIDALITAMMRAMVEQDSSLAELDKKYPGLITATGEAMRPVLLKASALTIPRYQADLAAFYSRNLTFKEANEFLTFLREPASRSFFGSVRNNVGFKAIANDLAAERDVSTKAMERDALSAARKSAEVLDPAAKQHLEAFFRSPLGVKIIGMGAQKREIDAKWVNYSPPEIEPEMERAVYEGMIGHINKTDPDVAAIMRQELFKVK